MDGGGRTDLEEAEALSHAVDIIDVYSNSWGPPDTGAHVSGPGTLTQLVLKMGATIVSKVKQSMHFFIDFDNCRVGMGRDQYTYGLVEMEEMKMTVLQMAMFPVYTP